MQYKIRKMTEEEYPLLEDFLYESLFVPQGKPPFPRSILQTPDMQILLISVLPSMTPLLLQKQMEKL